MELEEVFYVNSGKYDAKGIVLMLVTGFLSVIVLGMIYGIALIYIPYVYLNFLLTVGYGGVIGFSIAFCAKLGNVRNLKLVLIFAFVFGLLAEYFGWVTWIYAFSEFNYFTMSFSDIFSLMGVLAEEGSWSIFGWTPTGFALYFIWFVEAVIIIGGALVFAFIKFGHTPFCEDCHKWINDKKTIAYLQPVKSTESLVVSLIEHDFEPVLSLDEVKPNSFSYTEIHLVHCPDCQKHFYLSMNAIKITIKDKKEEKDEDTIIHNLILSKDEYEAILHNWDAKPESEI